MNTQSPSLPDICARRGRLLRPALCLELCPPRKGDWSGVLATVRSCRRYQPDFFTMTDTGRTRDATFAVAAVEVQRTYGLPVIAHLACAGRTRDELLRLADTLAEGGIRHILALRGDPARGTTFAPHPEGFRHPNEALDALRERHFPFTMGAACYPLGHPEDEEPNQELLNMVRKSRAGAKFFVGQVVLASSIDSYRKHAHAATLAGVPSPILPCHLAITSIERLGRIGKHCGVRIPDELLASLTRLGDKHVIPQMAGFARSMLVQGAPGLHVSTFNDPNATAAFLEHLF